MTRFFVNWINLAAVLLLALSGPSAAEDYPSRPITLVVPYAAGGGNDVMARIVAEKMSKSLGQQIVIENKGGAGGSIATRQIAKSAADGYTLGLGGTGTLAINPTLYPNVGYDPRKRSGAAEAKDRKSTRLNSSHANISYAVFCLKKKKR